MTDIIRPTLTPDAVVAEFLRGKAAGTIRAYASDVAHFARFLGVEDNAAAARALMGPNDPFHARQTALAWRNAMTEAGLSSNTVNRRLAALRSLVGFAQDIGAIAWSLRIKGLPEVPVRDATGPEPAVIHAAIHKANRRKNYRVEAMLRLLNDLALRRGAVCDLDLAHFDPVARKLQIREKGRRGGLKSVTVPAATARALVRWIAVRGDAPGPLFPGRGGARLCGDAVWKMTKALGLGHPHGFRHAGITAGLDATGGDVRSVAKFSGHRKIDQVIRYDDDRRDLGWRVANLVAAPEIEQETP